MQLDACNCKANGFGSCITCLRPGEYCNHAVRFPNNIYFPKRTEEFAIECERIRTYLNIGEYGGHHGLSSWMNLGMLDFFRDFHIDDPMHDITGVIDLLITILPNEIISKLSEFDNDIKLTKETMGHYVGFSKLKDFKAIDKINLILYYFGIALYAIGFDEEFILLINSIAEFYQTFNNKENGISIKEIWLFQSKIHCIIDKIGLFGSNKSHAFTHYNSNILKRGLFWNFNSFIFESFFNNLKKVCGDCKINSFPALENYLSDLIAQNLFNGISRNILLKFNVKQKKVNLLVKYQLHKPQRRPAFCKFRDLECNNELQQTENKTFDSYSRIEIAGQQITIERYSSKHKTSNHFAILKINDQLVYAKIIAIDKGSKQIYFQEGFIVEEDREKINNLFVGRVVKLTFKPIIQITSFQIFKKCNGFKILDFYYLTVK